MKRKPTPYETPLAEVMNITPEGVLCASTEEFGWNDGNDFDLGDDFSDWKH